jgi:DNA-binding transcriptional ArsR family regulator
MASITKQTYKIFVTSGEEKTYKALSLLATLHNPVKITLNQLQVKSGVKSQRTVGNSLKRLLRAGLITRTKLNKNKPSEGFKYKVNLGYEVIKIRIPNKFGIKYDRRIWRKKDI